MCSRSVCPEGYPYLQHCTGIINSITVDCCLGAVAVTVSKLRLDRLQFDFSKNCINFLLIARQYICIDISIYEDAPTLSKSLVPFDSYGLLEFDRVWIEMSIVSPSREFAKMMPLQLICIHLAFYFTFSWGSHSIVKRVNAIDSNTKRTLQHENEPLNCIEYF